MKSYRNLPYKTGSTHTKHLLDVYAPEEEGPHPTLLFVHGGSWYNGCKEWYEQLGHHLANKKVTCVVINYRLGNEATYEEMASDVAHAVKWTQEQIQQYQGDPQKLFIAGHSAGGHLSALVALNERFFRTLHIAFPLKGCILIDAFGLNMDFVMNQNQSFFVKELEKVFTKNPEKWKDAAPTQFVKEGAIPFLIFTGSDSYPHLLMDNEVFRMNLKAHRVPVEYQLVIGKDHKAMVTDLKDPNEPMYNDLLKFIFGQ